MLLSVHVDLGWPEPAWPGGAPRLVGAGAVAHALYPDPDSAAGDVERTRQGLTADLASLRRDAARTTTADGRGSTEPLAHGAGAGGAHRSLPTRGGWGPGDPPF
ncbi:hypothetical protein [Pseudokineococcus sp. 1T1Z-3]|uniref:hypothetical protein n=1 Tax=Pseudokineococcus sp. 1T1Z-3 TaxID=3132745 RepID=UPI0030AD6ADE